jgi:hypothetical protein
LVYVQSLFFRINSCIKTYLRIELNSVQLSNSPATDCSYTLQNLCLIISHPGIEFLNCSPLYNTLPISLNITKSFHYPHFPSRLIPFSAVGSHFPDEQTEVRRQTTVSLSKGPELSLSPTPDKELWELKTEKLLVAWSWAS